MSLFTRIGKVAVAAAAALVIAAGAAVAQDAKESTLDKVLREKKLTVGVILSIPPNGFKNDAGEPDGFDADVAKLAAKALGVDLEIVDTASADRIPSLRTGKVDLVIGQLTMNPERAKVIGFSDPYIAAFQMSVAVLKDSAVQKAADLAGKSVAVTKGSSNAARFVQIVPDATVLNFDSLQQGLLALQQGQVDAVIDDGNVLSYQAKIDSNVRVLDDEVLKKYVEYNGIGVRRGDQDWLNWVNQFVFDMNQSGQTRAIYKKWYEADMPNIQPKF